MNLSTSKTEILPTSKSANLVQNLMWMVWSGVVSIANSVLLWIFIARLREPEELGRFTIVMGLYSLFFIICSMGLMPYLVSEISRRTEEKELADFISSASIFLLISGIICTILMAASGFLISESSSVQISNVILSLAMLPTGLICVAEATAISFGKTRMIAFVTTFENLLRTIIPLGLLWYGFDISIICLSFVAVRFSALMIYFLKARKLLSKFSFNKLEFNKILKITPTFAGTIILAAINWQATIILLGRISTEVESAKFGVASRFLIPVTILMASYASVIQPTITRLTSENSGSYLSKAAGYPLILATLAAILSPFLSPLILNTLFGEKYIDVAPTLDILALSIIPFCLVMVVARALVTLNSQHIDFFANGIGVIATVTFGFWLIPSYGAKGAAMAQLASFLLMALVEIVYVSKKINSFKIWRTASVSLACLLATYIILWKN